MVAHGKPSSKKNSASWKNDEDCPWDTGKTAYASRKTQPASDRRHRSWHAGTMSWPLNTNTANKIGYKTRPFAKNTDHLVRFVDNRDRSSFLGLGPYEKFVEGRRHEFVWAVLSFVADGAR